MKQLYLLCIILLAGTDAWAQGEANNWYFGYGAGITFNGGTPTALTNGVLSTAEGSASLSDKNGNLLFYTDGITVWDRTHTQMPNGFGLTGNPSSAQSGIIVPRPGNPTRFYVFTVPAQGLGPGTCYSEVDMTLNGGLGDVIAATKNTFLFNPSCEKITAVKHANGQFVWVIGHEMNNNRYHAYLVDCNGVNPSVISDVGQVEGWPGWGYLVASPDGKKLGSAMRSVGFEVLDFDNATGVISNPVFLGQAADCYGISFSPDNNVLYGLQITGGAMFQWNLLAGSPAAISASVVSLGTAGGAGSGYRGGAMQLGPDGRLYVCQYGEAYLSVINNPNTLGTGCNFQTYAVDLQGKVCYLGLPPFIMSYFDTTAAITYNNTCPNRNTTFTINSVTTYLDSVKWNFGDAGSGAQNFSTALSPSHTYTAPGNYNVQLIRFIGCASDTTVTTLTIIPYATQTQNITLCPNSSFILPAGGTASAAGVYNDTIPASTGCDSIVTTNISIAPINVDAGPQAGICNGDSAQLNASGGLIYSWTPTTGLSNPNIANPIASPTTTTTYTVSSQVQIGNVITNGDFSAGNTGFTSSYAYTPPPNTNEGQYWVSTNAQAWNGGMASCGDHTNGSGNMLLVNGATTANVSIYCQTVAVLPNTDYAFSTWLMSLSAGNPAQLQFSINGSLLGSIFTADNNTCNWQQFYTTWNSGSNTNASICIVNQNTIASANDFALDDITFSAICNATDTVVVVVHQPSTTTIDTAICQGYTYTFPDGSTSTTATSNTSLLSDQFGCDSTVITNLTVHPSATSSRYDTICQGETFTRPSGITVTNGGTYIDTLATALGCDSIVTTNLTVNPISASSFSDTICRGQSYILPDGSSASTTGSYAVVLNNEYGCDSTVTVNLTVVEILLSATVNDAPCNGEAGGTITSIFSGGVNSYTFAITSNGNVIDGNSTGYFDHVLAGDYLLNVADEFGCNATITLQVTEPPLLVSSVSATDVTCFDANDGSISLAASGGVPGYTFTINPGSTNSSGNFSNLAADDYSYTITDANGCQDTASITITEPDELILTINPTNVEMDLGETAQINASTNYDPITQYTWTPEQSLSCYDCANPTVSAINSLEYHVEAAVNVNGNTCYAEANVPVTVIPLYDLFIPNVFTPNGDGLNDMFKVFGNIQALKFVEMNIFNRSGEKVFSTNDINFEWDGTYKGKQLEPGVFVYTMYAVFIDNHSEKLFKGSLTLLR